MLSLDGADHYSTADLQVLTRGGGVGSGGAGDGVYQFPHLVSISLGSIKAEDVRDNGSPDSCIDGYADYYSQTEAELSD